MRPYEIRADHIPQGILDFSGLNDAPAGKHGFLGVGEDGHFRFEDGSRVRFIGVNLVSDAGTPDKDAAPLIAERIARCGLNMVRFHHIDSLRGALRGRSILEYTNDCSTTLSAEGIDKLDYMIYQLKERGIYTHIDLFTLRSILPGDGPDYPDLLTDDFEIALKNIHWYNRRIQELANRYSELYLTHYNPYTKTRYVDEPAVAIVQMLNENSLFWDNRKSGRAFPSYRRELNRRWNQYLLDTYHDRAALDAAWTNGNGKKALLRWEDPARFNVLDPGLGFWNELYRQWDDPVGTEPSPAPSPAAPAAPSPTASPAAASPKPSPAASPNISPETSPVRVAEHKKFLSGIAGEYVEHTRAFLKKLGLKCCIDVSNIPLGVAELEIIARGDLTEKNTYWNHPQRDQEDRAAPDRFHHESSYRTSPLPHYAGERFESFKMNIISSNSFGAVAKKPLVITEWNVPHPLPFRSDVVMQMACYGTLQDWDGMLLFAYSHTGTKEQLGLDHINGYFDSCNDPAVWGLMALSAEIYRKGLVKTARNLIDICYTTVDTFHQSDYMVPYRPIPFISRVQARYTGPAYQGEADLAISSGFTASGDYRNAKHALVYSRSPYGDLHQQSDRLEEFLTLHEQAPNCRVFRDGGTVDRDSQEFYRQLRLTLRHFNLTDQDYTMEDDEPLTSDTGELVYDYKAGAMTAHTPRFNAYTGDGGPRLVGDILYQIDNRRICASLLSRDGKPLENSGSILITAIGDCSNTGLTWDGDQLLSPGRGPILIDPFRGSVSLKNPATRCNAWALDDQGRRQEPLTATSAQGRWIIDCRTRTPAMYYELEFR
jgi:hypothetical protein